jgi:protoporphyrinogen oxidase
MGMSADYNSTTEVCILGGGPTSLTAAFELSANVVEDIVLVDSNANLGGLTGTVDFDGNLFDVEPHRFYDSHASAIIAGFFSILSRLKMLDVY